MMDKEIESHVKTLTTAYSTQKHPFPKNQYIVLKYMAVKGPNPKEPQTKYALSKYALKPDGKKINYTSICEVVDKFIKIGIFKETEIEITHGSQTMKKYELTLRGLFLSLIACDQATGLIDSNVYKEITEKWATVEPILLGKYNFLAKNLGEEIAKAIIYQTVSNSIGNEDWATKERSFDAYSTLLDNLHDSINRFEAYSNLLDNLHKFGEEVLDQPTHGEINPRGLLDKLLTVFAKDPELTDYLKVYLKYAFKKAKAEQEWVLLLEKKIGKTD
jgi:hypothetical protein